MVKFYIFICMKRATYFNLQNYKIYKNFILECKSKVYNNSLVLHKHHIIPKCMWANDEISVNNSTNIVNLSVEDHVTAHILFANCYECNTYEYIVNMRSARILNKKSIKDKKILADISKTYIGENNPFYGKKHSLETIKKLAEFNSKNFKNVSYEERYGDNALIEKEKRKKGVAQDWKRLSKKDKEQRCKNISNGLKGKMNGSKNPFAKPMLVDGIYYGSLVEACEKLKLSSYKLYKNHKVEKLNK